ncbi:hypothetical protein ACFFSW_21560 [Saccharothrix longispora]|uniref:Uncharacterized protein n=1 Tax=Saccharothrix longispora TaxID=33920 RepID=A0ABU1Q6B4_9PSEU|nr:hypothetical protein [Saccharothrix longispora]MDR6598428.1 hypothetical protein [Saccharothrix longispora]
MRVKWWRRAEPTPGPLVFEPSEVDRATARAEIEQLATSLTGAVDEAIGDPLANTVNTWTDQWLSAVRAEHARYATAVEKPLGAANATLAELDQRKERDGRALAEAAIARETAARWLGGDGQQSDIRDEGFEDPTLLAGRPRSFYLHLLALALGAGADIGAFVQVVELLMRGQSTAIAVLLVVGLTAVVLYLAHTAGVLLRERKAGTTWVRWIGATCCLLVWAAVGFLAAWARLITPRPRTGSVKLDFNAPASASATAPVSFANASTFLALYIASGIAACLGAYLWHNRAHSGFSAAVRRYDRASKRAGRSARAQARATATWHEQVKARDAAVAILAEAEQARTALGEDLKLYAKVLLSAQAKDPAFTDAVLAPDQRPYPYNPGSLN